MDIEFVNRYSTLVEKIKGGLDAATADALKHGRIGTSISMLIWTQRELSDLLKLALDKQNQVRVERSVAEVKWPVDSTGKRSEESG